MIQEVNKHKMNGRQMKERYMLMLIIGKKEQKIKMKIQK